MSDATLAFGVHLEKCPPLSPPILFHNLTGVIINPQFEF